MIEICERRIVQCPSEQAAQHMSTFIAHHLVADGRVRIAFRRNASDPAGRRAPIECHVVATFALQSPADRYPAYSVIWLAGADAPLPAFDGTLSVERCGLDDCVGLMLSGGYTPSAAGFTPSVRSPDSRIARLSVRGVLQAVASHVRVACARQEAAIAGQRRYLQR